jgi:molecular chaperone GrpE
LNNQEPNQGVTSAVEAEPLEQTEVEQDEEENVIKQLQKTVEELGSRCKQEEDKANNYLTRIKYLQADFENYRKMVETQTSQRLAREKEHLLSGLLNIRDDLERALESAKLEGHPITKGVKMIFENLNSYLGQEGVGEIPALGKAFDPNLHEAVNYVSRDDCEDNTIVKEIRKGYTLNGKVIRISLVEVAKRQISQSSKL